MSRLSLGILDYAVISLMLLISLAIGVWFKFARTQNASQFLLGGKNMSRIPVFFSIAVTAISGVSMISTPTEVYRYDIQPLVMAFGNAIGLVLATFIFVPVYFQCGVSTVYEFIEMRYGRTLRRILSALFIIQMVLYMCVAIIPPVLSLSVVSNLSFEFCIITFGSICSLYCMLGGLKGVLWTDVFQFSLIFIYFVIIYNVGIPDAGGFTNMFRTAWNANKLRLDFGTSVIKRYTFWSGISSGIVFGLGTFGATQTEVQRLLSLSNVKKAKTTLILGGVLFFTIHIVSSVFGLVLYSIYHSCDPVLNKNQTGLQKYDQLIPYYIVNKFTSVPGLTGLCTAGIFSGSLSTVSSVLNSLATVTVVDWIKPIVGPERMDDNKTVTVARGISLFYGLLCVTLPFAMISTPSVRQLCITLFSIIDGALTAVFLAGVLSRSVNEKSAMFGLAVGVIFASVIGYSTLTGGYIEAPANLGSNCPSAHANFSMFRTSPPIAYLSENTNTSYLTPMDHPPDDSFSMKKLSYQWIRPIGFITSIAAMFMCSLLPGLNKTVVPVDSIYLSPVTQLWTYKKTISSEKNSAKNMEMTNT